MQFQRILPANPSASIGPICGPCTGHIAPQLTPKLRKSPLPIPFPGKKAHLSSILIDPSNSPLPVPILRSRPSNQLRLVGLNFSAGRKVSSVSLAIIYYDRQQRRCSRIDRGWSSVKRGGGQRNPGPIGTGWRARTSVWNDS